jgi:hypothetical protein
MTITCVDSDEVYTDLPAHFNIPKPEILQLDKLQNRKLIDTSISYTPNHSLDKHTDIARVSHDGSTRLRNSDESTRFTRSDKSDDEDALYDKVLDLYKQYEKFKSKHVNIDFSSDLENVKRELVKEHEDKKLLIDKLNILRRTYKDLKITSVDKDSDYETVQTTYDDTMRILYAEASTDDYKCVMVIMFASIEIMLSYLKIDSKGYTQYQMSKFKNYERVLIELGETTILLKYMSMPPIGKLVFLVLLNTGAFVLMKRFVPSFSQDMDKYSGVDIPSMFGSVMNVMQATGSGCGSSSYKAAETNTPTMRRPTTTPHM